MVLLSMFFSPGTGSIVATTVWVPLRRGRVELDRAGGALAGERLGHRRGAGHGRLVPLTVTLHLTLCSLLVPPLGKVSVNGGDRAGRDGVGAPRSAAWCRPTLTDVSEWPCRPGAGLVGLGARHVDVQHGGQEARQHPLDVGHELVAVDGAEAGARRRGARRRSAAGRSPCRGRRRRRTSRSRRRWR